MLGKRLEKIATSNAKHGTESLIKTIDADLLEKKGWICVPFGLPRFSYAKSRNLLAKILRSFSLKI